VRWRQGLVVGLAAFPGDRRIGLRLGPVQQSLEPFPEMPAGLLEDEWVDQRMGLGGVTRAHTLDAALQF
jgi:hypothetical protein